MDCSKCGHDDMVHFMFAGCCGHMGCPCEGNSATDSRCRKSRHGEDCWWAIPRQIADLSEGQKVSILALHHSGFGTRKIGIRLGIKRSEVMRIIRTESIP